MKLVDGSLMFLGAEWKRKGNMKNKDNETSVNTNFWKEKSVKTEYNMMVDEKSMFFRIS